MRQKRNREREKVGTPVTVRYHQLFRVRYLEGNEVRAVFVPPLSVRFPRRERIPWTRFQ